MKTSTVQLGELIEIEKGKKASQLLDGPNAASRRYLQIDDLRPDAKPKFVKPFECPMASETDVVIAWDGANAGTVSCNLNGYIGSTLAVLRPSTGKLFAPFLSLFLEGRFDYLQTNATGATVPHLNRDILENLQIPLPPLSDQQRTAEQLEQVNRLRRTRRYALELTDTFLPAAFLQLFGDPADNPHSFDRVQVEQLFSSDRDGAKCGPFGSALKKHEYVSTGIPVWTMDCVGENDFREDDCLFITEQKFAELRAYDAQNGDILISRAGTVGRMAIVRTKQPRSIIHSNIIRLSLNPARIMPIYFVTLMTWFGTKVARLKRGQEGAYTFMSTGTLGELRIPLPPFALQQQFAAIVEGVERLRSVQRESLRQAEHLFQTLLHRAFARSA